MFTVQVSVRNKDSGVVIVELLDDRGNGIVQLGGDQMAALTRQDFQLAVLVEAGQYRVFYAEALDGLVQLLEVVAVAVNGEGVNVCFFQIGRVKNGGESFALAGDWQRFLVLLCGRAQLFAQQLCDRRACRPSATVPTGFSSFSAFLAGVFAGAGFFSLSSAAGAGASIVFFSF